MKEIREIGIEKELFLMKGEDFREPKAFGFPYDEMGFLVEIRSLPSDRLYPVYSTLEAEELQYRLRANKFGMSLESTDTMFCDTELGDKIAEEYHIHDFEDFTQNIYEELKKEQSHHLGMFSVPDNGYRLTAGIHVHFSSRDSDTGEVIDLPIEDIVRKMDIVFKHDIKRSNRMKGEWEEKEHGFEYRSLPNNADIYRVLKESFRILRSV